MPENLTEPQYLSQDKSMEEEDMVESEDDDIHLDTDEHDYEEIVDEDIHDDSNRKENSFEEESSEIKNDNLEEVMGELVPDSEDSTVENGKSLDPPVIPHTNNEEENEAEEDVVNDQKRRKKTELERLEIENDQFWRGFDEKSLQRKCNSSYSPQFLFSSVVNDADAFMPDVAGAASDMIEKMTRGVGEQAEPGLPLFLV